MHNLKAGHLYRIFLSYLDKASECNVEIIPIVMDGASTNVKVARMLLKETSQNLNGKPTPIVSLKLETSFVHNDKIYFMLFFIAHLIKKIRNALFKKVNDFNYPKLELKWIRFRSWDMQRQMDERCASQEQEKIVCNYRTSKNVACTDNLKK